MSHTHSLLRRRFFSWRMWSQIAAFAGSLSLLACQGEDPKTIGGQSSGSGGSPMGAGASGSLGSGGVSEGASGGATATGGAPGGDSTAGALGAYPVDNSALTQGGTMTFTNVGAPGWWPRRLNRPIDDPACDYKAGTDTWGGACCMKEQYTQSTTLAPFDEEMTLIFKAVKVSQLAVYQPAESDASGPWVRVSSYDDRTGSSNLWLTQEGSGSKEFNGDFTQKDCVNYVMQEPVFSCGDGADYYCPEDPGINHLGFSGSKLVVFLASMTFSDTDIESCSGGEVAPQPWIAFVASELIRDGARKWNGACNCYSKTGSVGDGCGEINVFEVVMDNNEFSNREFISTGVRSFQEGHVGGNVCGSGCGRDEFGTDVDVVDACAQKAYDKGPVIDVGGTSDGCPVWRRPEGQRYFMILLDEPTRTIQVAIVHPQNIPKSAEGVLPLFPKDLSRSAVTSLVDMRLPQ